MTICIGTAGATATIIITPVGITGTDLGATATGDTTHGTGTIAGTVLGHTATGDITIVLTTITLIGAGTVLTTATTDITTVTTTVTTTTMAAITEATIAAQEPYTTEAVTVPPVITGTIHQG